eukprot:scaffold228061_cov34-Tisochrysis_lutea.AAC.1
MPPPPLCLVIDDSRPQLVGGSVWRQDSRTTGNAWALAGESVGTSNCDVERAKTRLLPVAHPEPLVLQPAAVDEQHRAAESPRGFIHSSLDMCAPVLRRYGPPYNDWFDGQVMKVGTNKWEVTCAVDGSVSTITDINLQPAPEIHKRSE